MLWHVYLIQHISTFCPVSVQYHGHVIGFENLYIVDSSTDSRCLSFLRYARDHLGANVMFGDINLNELEGVLSSIGENIAGSSDVFLKVDTDEFLLVYDEANMAASTSVSDYLADFAKDKNHPLRLNTSSVVGYRQESVPSKEVCKEDIYTLPEKFPLDEVKIIGSTRDKWYKAVYSSPTFFGDTAKVNLGGHAVEPHRAKYNIWTKFLMVHYHSRCIEIEIESAKRVLERHDLISPSDTDEAASAKLTQKMGCGGDQLCDNKCRPRGIPSYHKAVFYVQWLHCPEKIEKDYYKQGGKGAYNQGIHDIWRISEEKFGL